MTALLGSGLTDGIMRQSAFTLDHDHCTNDTRGGHHPLLWHILVGLTDNRWLSDALGAGEKI